MGNRISRREFLKLLSLLPLSFAAPKLFPPNSHNMRTGAENVIIVVFDAFSALNMSLYGYHRDTTPNLNQIASQATVYHNHYAAASFTTPGTASLLTGVYPWTHRGFRPGSTVHSAYANRNIFSLFGNYFRLTYSHNLHVNRLQNQFAAHLDLYKHREELAFGKNNWVADIFNRDDDIALLSWIRAMDLDIDGCAYSLFLSHLYGLIQDRNADQMSALFPRGLPEISSGVFFILEDAVDWIRTAVSRVPNPFLGYFHLLPPHSPYNTRRDFVGHFKNDGWIPVAKPAHVLAKKGRDRRQVDFELYRRLYDEYILYVDAEFARLYAALEKDGVLESSWLILTSDHGEMFERGIFQHMTPTLYQPVIRIPLLIFEPGHNSRRDVFENTSAVDLLPTLLSLTNQSIPEWVEGRVLPPFGSLNSQMSSVFALDAKLNNPTGPLTKASTMIVKGGYKLTNYYGYRELGNQGPLIELYDVDNDADELADLSTIHPEVVTDLLEELEERVASADLPYQESSLTGIGQD
ncbi:MAG: sulfatase-like hydrolase/transferase [Anaerolineales bacterium]|jgi:arylsulfatase A-like enzyme